MFTGKSFEQTQGAYIKVEASREQIDEFQTWLILKSLRWHRGTAQISDTTFAAFFDAETAARVTRWWTWKKEEA